MLAVVMLLPAMNASAVNFKPIASIDKDGKPVDLKLRSKACIIVDIESGDSIYNMNGDKELPIATMNMLMTSLLIVEKYQDIQALKSSFASAGSEAYDELLTRDVGFPVGLVLDGNGNPNIDTRKDCVSRNPVDVRIPLDYDAAMQIFRDKEDYELNWAMQYLRSNA